MPEESATPDLVELWQQWGDAAARGDLDTAMSMFATDSVWEVRPLGVTLSGREAIRGFAESWLADYEEYEHAMLEGRDLGNGVVFAVERQDARLRGSPGTIHEQWAITVEWNARTIVRVTAMRNIDEARAAAERLAELRG
ncbi:MAG TPA: nuclear transport factor 2 family protein [Solirubrobacteraceae bacterium]|nr:nuclear transport factor 2 family protein [Solirubrobacteraceae bacterium]HME03317.1 nuclear transport factor 2 family protein [Solirubrobacteraceae bacterium]